MLPVKPEDDRDGTLIRDQGEGRTTLRVERDVLRPDGCLGRLPHPNDLCPGLTCHTPDNRVVCVQDGESGCRQGLDELRLSPPDRLL